MPVAVVRLLWAGGSLYVLLVILAYALSVGLPDAASAATLRMRMQAAGCQQYRHVRAANPLNIADFYLNTRYWLAEYRVSQRIMADARCQAVLQSTLRPMSHGVSAAVVNEAGEVVGMFKGGA